MDYAVRMPHDITPFLPAIIIAIVIVRLIRRTRRPRVIKPWRLWVAPVIVLGGAVFYVFGAIHMGVRITPADSAIIAATAFCGVALGALRAHSVKLTKHPQTGVIEATLTVWGVAIVLAWVGVRTALRNSGYLGATTPFSVFSDAALALALATVLSQAIVLTRRYQLLSAATSGSPGA